MSERATESRVPPHALEAERAVLGGILLQNSVIDTVVEIVQPCDFYSEGNARILESMLDLHRVSTPIDTITLRAELMRTNRLQSVGGDDYILSLTDTLPTVENIKAHATIVKEKALVRRMITACHGVAARGYGDYGDPSEFLDGAEKAVFDVANIQTRATVQPIAQIIHRAFEEITELARAGKRISGLSSGFSRLDAMTAGMHPGDLIIVAGRPGMGKTSFALNVGVNACHAQRTTVGIFSLEMPRDQLVKRMLCSEARVDASRMRTGQLARDDWPQLAEAAGMLSDLPIFIDDTPALTLMELRAKARRMASENRDTKLGLLIIDYLQLMRSGTKNDSREQEISEISRSLKGLAKELSIPVIALSQLNRGVESRGNKDKRPQLSDLRESGAIEQDADTIMFVYRDEVYNKETMDQGVAEIIVGKQRAGPTGTVKVRFFNQYTRFDNLADEDYAADGADVG